MPPATPEILSIAEKILTSVKEIEAQVRQCNKAHHTDQEHEPFSSLPEGALQLREEVLDALDQVHMLVLGPLGYLMRVAGPAV